jgi:hypothetical protein
MGEVGAAERDGEEEAQRRGLRIHLRWLRGLLIGAKVHAFLCTGSTCNNLTPSTTYYVANAGNSSAGGATITTDGSALGPNDSANWSAASYFGGSYQYWSNRIQNRGTQWMNGSLYGSNGGACNDWVDSASSGDGGELGYSAEVSYFRWYLYGAPPECNTTQNLICYVNP